MPTAQHFSRFENAAESIWRAFERRCWRPSCRGRHRQSSATSLPYKDSPVPSRRSYAVTVFAKMRLLVFEGHKEWVFYWILQLEFCRGIYRLYDRQSTRDNWWMWSCDHTHFFLFLLPICRFSWYVHTELGHETFSEEPITPYRSGRSYPVSFPGLMSWGHWKEIPFFFYCCHSPKTLWLRHPSWSLRHCHVKEVTTLRLWVYKNRYSCHVQYARTLRVCKGFSVALGQR